MKVLVTSSRVGPHVEYKAGQVVNLPDYKAERAIKNGWAEKVVSNPTPTVQDVKLEAQGNYTIEGLLEQFDNDASLLKAFAKSHDIYIHARTKNAETIAQKIVDHFA
jgi:hypothetical protein